MKAPTSDQVFELVSVFDRAIEIAPPSSSVDMYTGLVSVRHTPHPASTLKNHQCGTVHCHAGWFLLGLLWDGTSPFLHQKSVSYFTGTEKMARMLGFTSPFEMQIFFDKNPSIWGNTDGYYMFSAFSAFNSTKEALSLEKIRDHWTGVGLNLLAQETGD